MSVASSHNSRPSVSRYSNSLKRTPRNEDCQRAFDRIKKDFTNPPVPGRPLLLYLSTTETSMGCVLGQHDDTGRREQAIYYLSKKLTDCESRYSPLEKTCLALVWATQRLRHYRLIRYCFSRAWTRSSISSKNRLFQAELLGGKSCCQSSISLMLPRNRCWDKLLLITLDVTLYHVTSRP